MKIADRLTPKVIDAPVTDLKMGIGLLTLIVTLLCPFDDSNAASFDCAKAKTVLEKLICSEPVLDEADANMGEAYRRALKSFPIPGFIQATQQWFLSGYRNCASHKDPKADVAKCLEALSVRTKELHESTIGKIYYNGTGKFSVEDTVLLLVQSGNKGVLRYFGGWMPDAYRPRPFPDGKLCADDLELKMSNGELVSADAAAIVKISEDKITIESLLCSPRTGILGDYTRVKR